MAGDVVKERLEVGGAAETMEKLQTCSILLQRWWYSSKLSDTLCMLLLHKKRRERALILVLYTYCLF